MKPLQRKSFLLRFDDICPTMCWDMWSEIEACLIRSGMKPILAVVPDNRDPVLQVAPPVSDFWDRVRRWQDLGWTIAMHGYQHLYVARHGGLVTTRKKSEFSSLPAEQQAEKLHRGIEIFRREGIRSRVWIAPGNAFDEVTVSLLPQIGVDIISAGWFWNPFIGPHRMTWLPCQLSILRTVPAGVWTVCYHHNPWTSSDLTEFKTSLEQYKDRIVSLPEMLASCRPATANWCYNFCTSPRLSALVLRVHLKLWKMWRSHWPESEAIASTTPSVVSAESA